VNRLLIVLAAGLLLAAGAAGLMLAFGARDEPEVAAASGPGEVFADQCAEHRRRPEGFRFRSDPPTSGPHVPAPVRRDGRRLTTDQLLHALELGNVVLTYDSARPPAALRRLQASVAGRFDPELAAAGQAIVLARMPTRPGVTALAWRHRLAVRTPGDPRLAAFAEHWLGRGFAGAGAPSCS
jgi:uncharacterized protein DUF3105